MEKDYLDIYQKEVLFQCELALRAAYDLEHALKTWREIRTAFYVWYSVQSFLIAVGNISKLLWPSKNPKKMLIPERYSELRKSLSVDINSPLKSMKFRNYFEHFDDQLDKWVKESKQHIFIDSYIGPSHKFKGPGSEGALIRSFDPITYTLTFRGDKYHLKPIINAVQELYQKAKIEARKPTWEEPISSKK